jgi:hypothetical protein
MPKHLILRSYARLPATLLADKALLVAEKMTDNPNFTDPDVALTLLTDTANQLIAATVQAADGTKRDTAHKHALQKVLIAQLNTQANYVENAAQNSAEIILSSGFDLASTTRLPALVTGTAITAVTNVASTKLGVELVVDSNAWAYELQLSTVPDVWSLGFIFTDPRDITLTGLVPGTIYAIRVRVHGSNNQVSEWSMPVSHMAT